jgi:cobalt-zinc-cadmium resistance protein CzcA
MENFLAGMIRQRLLVLTLFLAVSVAGVFSLLNLPIDAFPDLANNQVQIITESPGLGPVEVEQLVTIPLESVMNGLPNVDETRSISKYGLSVVSVIFKDKVDILCQAARSRALTKCTRPPARQHKPTAWANFNAMVKLSICLRGRGYSATELKQFKTGY